MLTKGEKSFFLRTARGAGELSGSNIKGGAVLVKGKKLLSTGCNKIIVKGHKWEMSAIFDAIFSARDVDLTDTAIFSTYFPDINDIKLIIATGVSKVYFYGKIDNPETVELMNSLVTNLIPLEIFQLE